MKYRIGWCSGTAVDGAHGTASAYSTDVLLPHLSQWCDVEVFHNSFREYPRFRSAHYLTLAKRHHQSPFDLVVYQIEDAASCDFARAHVGLLPGLAIFHDFICKHPGPEPFANSPWEHTVALMQEREMRFPKRGSYPEYRPHALREAGGSFSALFVDERSHDEFRRLSRGSLSELLPETLRSAVLPTPVDISVQSSAPASRVLFCGSPHVENRGHALFAALQALRQPMPCTWLVAEHEEAVARELVRDCGIDAVQIISGRSPERWIELVRGGGIAVHTQFSVYGSLMPYLAISLMAGLPSIVTRFGSGDFLPDHAVCKVNPGRGEFQEIASALELLRGSAGAALGARAREHAMELFDARSVAGELMQHIAALAPALVAPQQRWQQLAREARRSLRAEVRGLLAPTIKSGELWRDGASLWDTALQPSFKALGWEVQE